MEVIYTDILQIYTSYLYGRDESDLELLMILSVNNWILKSMFRPPPLPNYRLFGK